MTDAQFAKLVYSYQIAKADYEYSRIGSAKAKAGEARMDRIAAKVEAAGRSRELTKAVYEDAEYVR